MISWYFFTKFLLQLSIFDHCIFDAMHNYDYAYISFNEYQFQKEFNPKFTAQSNIHGEKAKSHSNRTVHWWYIYISFLLHILLNQQGQLFRSRDGASLDKTLSSSLSQSCIWPAHPRWQDNQDPREWRSRGKGCPPPQRGKTTKITLCPRHVLTQVRN